MSAGVLALSPVSKLAIASLGTMDMWVSAFSPEVPTLSTVWTLVLRPLGSGADIFGAVSFGGAGGCGG
jgi:hypothetical protein